MSLNKKNSGDNKIASSFKIMRWLKILIEKIMKSFSGKDDEQFVHAIGLYEKR
jgi:hypothetical protein